MSEEIKEWKEAKPISRSLVERLKEANVAVLKLHFSGGHDESYLSASTYTSKGVALMERAEIYYGNEPGTLEGDISEWAWGAFSYSGAGEGKDYGDDYTYNLDTGTVQHTYWQDEPEHTEYKPQKLEYREA